MGCLASQEESRQRVSHRVYSVINFDSVSSHDTEHVELSMQELLKKDVGTILHGLQRINQLDDISPVVCVDENAFPLLLCDFLLAEEVTDQIPLPCAAIARCGNGRLFVFGSHLVLTHSMLTRTETSAFIENLFSWGSGFRMKTTRILVSGFPGALSSVLVNDLTGLGYICEGHPGLPKNLACDIIFCLSNVKYDLQALSGFLAMGGSVFVFMAEPDEHDRFWMNDYLSQHGLAFCESSLVAVKDSFPLRSVEVLEESTFQSVVGQYRKMLELNHMVTVGMLDPVVGKLRYYVRGMCQDKVEQIEELLKMSWDFLYRVGYRDANGICSSDVHCVIAVLISELALRLPVSRVPVSPCADLFPGIVGDEMKLSTRTMRQVIHRNELVSSGLYLPPGVVARVECSMDITLQIGAHSEVLFMKPGPWKRWPLVTMKVDVEKDKPKEFASMFGGIMYLIGNKSKSVMLTCTGLARYPRYHIQRPDYWDATKIYPVPWAEIETKELIFTVPTECARKIQDMTTFAKSMDEFASNVWKFLGGRRSTRIQRVIFDVDLPEGDSISGDVIFTTVHLLDGLAQQDKPTADLMRLLTLFGLSVLPPGLFDGEAQMAISMVAVAHVMKEKWPNSEPSEFVTSATPRIFYDLWHACERFGDQPFENAIKQYTLQKDTSVDNTPQEQWLVFARELSRQTHNNLYEIKDRFKQTQKVSMDVSNHLTGYTLEDLEA